MKVNSKDFLLTYTYIRANGMYEYQIKHIYPYFTLDYDNSMQDSLRWMYDLYESFETRIKYDIPAISSL